jgi:hypothetical protein
MHQGYAAAEMLNELASEVEIDYCRQQSNEDTEIFYKQRERRREEKEDE